MMPAIYVFRGFPRSIGFIVAEGEKPWENLSSTLEFWGRGKVTVHNFGAYVSTGQIEKVKELPDTDEGWDESFEPVEELGEY